jgi:hypothetical protein
VFSHHRPPLFFLPFLVALSLPLVALACSDDSVAVDSGPGNEQTSDGGGGGGGGGDSASAQDGANTGATNKLGPNDVSILWPIPQDGELPAAGYLKVFPKTNERGPGFPIAQADTFGDLHGDLPSSAWQSTLAVIALRVDPCSAANDCAKELRLSAETISPALSDAAMHLIYKLTDAAFNSLIDELDVWRKHSPVATGARLSVHPGLEAAGITSPFAKELHDIVIRYATEAALTRVTINSFAMDNWGFRQFDKLSSGWTRTAIPGLEFTESQSWLRQAAIDSTTDPSGTITPAPAAATKKMAALQRADALANGPTSAEVLVARDAINHFENPTLSNAATADCASCHMANQTHRWAARNGVSFDSSSRYTSPTDITVATVPASMNGNLGSTIAFGHHRIHNGNPADYNKSFPEISTRVAHETTEVLIRLNANR